MSKSITSFIKSDLSITDFILKLEDILKISFVQNVQVEWDLFATKIMGLFISVYDSEGFVDDLGINFSSFNYVIDVELVSMDIPEKYRNDWDKIFSIILIHILSKQLKCDFIITDDMQEILDRSASK